MKCPCPCGRRPLRHFCRRVRICIVLQAELRFSGLHNNQSSMLILTASVVLQQDLAQLLRNLETSSEAALKPRPPFRPRPSRLRFESRPADHSAIPVAVCHCTNCLSQSRDVLNPSCQLSSPKFFGNLLSLVSHGGM